MSFLIKKVSLDDKEDLKILLNGFFVNHKSELSQKTQEIEAYKNSDKVIEETASSYFEYTTIL